MPDIPHMMLQERSIGSSWQNEKYHSNRVKRWRNINALSDLTSEAQATTLQGQ